MALGLSHAWIVASALTVVVLSVYGTALMTQNVRLMMALGAVQEVRPVLMVETSVTDPKLYVTADERGFVAPGRPLVLVVAPATDCQVCDETLRIWQRVTEWNPTPDLWVAAPRTIDTASNWATLSPAIDISARRLTIADPERYSALTGINSAPMSVVVSDAGRIVCAVAGLPAFDVAAQCLTNLQHSAENTVLTARGVGVVPFNSDSLASCPISR